MKLFVWNNPYLVSYGGSCLYVIAANLKQARKQALKARSAVNGRIGANRSFDVRETPPTRVHNLPHAEIYHWEE